MSSLWKLKSGVLQTSLRPVRAMRRAWRGQGNWGAALSPPPPLPAPCTDRQSQQPLLLPSLLSLAPLPPISVTSHSASAASAPLAQTLQKHTLSGPSPRSLEVTEACVESPSPVDGLHLQHGGFSASREAHKLMAPGEILSLEGAGVQGTHRVGVAMFLASRYGSGRRGLPRSPESPGRPPAVTSR